MSRQMFIYKALKQCLTHSKHYTMFAVIKTIIDYVVYFLNI